MKFLETLATAVTNVANSAVSTVANTEAGKYLVVKPVVTAQFNKAKTSVESFLQEIDTIESVPQDLKQTFDELKDQSDVLTGDLLANETIDPLVEILGNQIHGQGIEKVKNNITNSQAMSEMKDFGLKLIDVENYLTLFHLMKTKDSAGSYEVIEKIKKENRQMNLKEIILEAKKTTSNLGKELNLQEDETKKITVIFDSLVNKHLHHFNRIRFSIIHQLPGYFDQFAMKESEKAALPKRKLDQALDNASQVEERPLKKPKLS